MPKMTNSISTYPAAILVRRCLVAIVFCFIPEWEFLSLLGLYFGYIPFQAELFPPDGSLFLQCRQCSGEFVLPA